MGADEAVDVGAVDGTDGIEVRDGTGALRPLVGGEGTEELTEDRAVVELSEGTLRPEGTG